MLEHRSINALFEKILKRADAARVRQIQFALGEMSGLDQTIIQQQWDGLIKGTPLEHARIRFRSIIAEAQCMACFKKYHPVNGIIHCPHCGSFGAKILSGEEFHVDTVETDDE